jgi:hypothetical protein
VLVIVLQDYPSQIVAEFRSAEIGVVWIHQNHRIVRRTAPEGAGTRIEDPVLAVYELAIAALLRRIIIVAHEKAPCHVCML